MTEYRKAVISDADALAKIRVDFLCDANDVTEPSEIELLYNNNLRFMTDSLTDGSFSAWLAVTDGEIVATSGVSFYVLPPNKKCPDGRVAYISNMFTYPKYRGLGIASRLFELTVGEARGLGCSKILLNATDMGRPIYEKFGFCDTKNDMVFYT